MQCHTFRASDDSLRVLKLLLIGKSIEELKFSKRCTNINMIMDKVQKDKKKHIKNI